MDERVRVIHQVSEWLRAGKLVCIATLIETEGSTPRKPGAKLAVSSDGEVVGTIGGGGVEKRVIDEARKVMTGGGVRIIEFDLAGKTPGLDAFCGGKVKIVLEPVGELRRLVIIGAGHIGKALASIAEITGFSVVLVDDREDVLKDGISENIEVIVASPNSWSQDLVVDETTFIVVATRKHSLDKEWLARIADFNPTYVGMVGSKRKAQAIFEALRQDGISEGFIKNIKVPVGIDIGAETPEEIAVSIMAQIIAELHQKVRDEV